MSKTTTRSRRGNMRNEMIGAGLNLLDEGGIGLVGVRQIARKVGVAHSAPANHFKNKQAILTAIATNIFSGLLESIDENINDTGDDLRASIHLFSKVILDFALEYPNRYKLICRTDCINREDKDLYSVMEQVYGRLTELLNEYSKLKNIDVESQAIALWSLIHGYISFRLEGVLITGQDAVTGINRKIAIIDVMLDGLIQKSN